MGEADPLTDAICEMLKKKEIVLVYNKYFDLGEILKDEEPRALDPWLVTFFELYQGLPCAKIRFTFRATEDAGGAQEILKVCRAACLPDGAIPPIILESAAEKSEVRASAGPEQRPALQSAAPDNERELQS